MFTVFEIPLEFVFELRLILCHRNTSFTKYITKIEELDKYRINYC